MTTADDILTSLFSGLEDSSDIEGPCPERAAEKVYQRFIKPLEDKLALADAVVVGAVQLIATPYNEIHLHVDESDSEVRHLLLEIARAVRDYGNAPDHVHIWRDTGFANVEDCAVCGDTRTEKEDL